MKPGLIAFSLAAASVSLAACADVDLPGLQPSAPHVVQSTEYGRVARVELFREGSSSPATAGTILGGLAGGVIGHQIGGGHGNELATIAGAVGGAVVGNKIQKSRQADRYRITVILDDGRELVLEQAGEGDLRVGDRVRVVNDRVQRA